MPNPKHSPTTTTMSDNAPDYGDIVNFPNHATDGTKPDEDKRWIVLYEDDYDNHAVDMDGNVGVLMDAAQARELYRLSTETLLALAHPDGGEDAIREMIETLEGVIDDDS